MSKFNLEDVTRLECRTREARGEHMNYDVVGICVRDKNDQLKEMDFSSSWEMQPLEGLLSHFNAWLHGDEVGSVVCRIQCIFLWLRIEI